MQLDISVGTVTTLNINWYNNKLCMPIAGGYGGACHGHVISVMCGYIVHLVCFKRIQSMQHSVYPGFHTGVGAPRDFPPPQPPPRNYI